MAREKQLATQAQRPLATLEPWDTFREMDRMFRDFFTAPLPWWRGQRWLSDLRTEFSPEVDLRETEKELVLSTTIPGVNKDDIDINVTSDRITISGERKPAYPVVGTIEKSPFFQLFFLISPRSSSIEGAFSGGSASFVRGGGWGSEEFGPEAEALKADTNGAAGEMTVGPGGHALEGGGVQARQPIQDFSRSFRSGNLVRRRQAA